MIPLLVTALMAFAAPGHVVGCSHVAHHHCRGFWWYAAGGPTVYRLRTHQPVPGYVYIDDTTPCGPGEPYPMNTITARLGSRRCEQRWVTYYRRRARVVWAAAPGRTRTPFRRAVTLLEWYPAYGHPLKVPCGFGGYIVQRYFTGHGVGGEYPWFRTLWRGAQRCRRTRVMAWY